MNTKQTKEEIIMGILYFVIIVLLFCGILHTVSEILQEKEKDELYLDNK